ncbi:hypothetical protein NECAME_18812, partial [Necator americanus]
MESEETEREVQRKNSKREELERELEDLLQKHNDAFVSTFGECPSGPWSASVNDLVRTREESNQQTENELRKSERDLDRASQGLEQTRAEEEKLIGEVEQLRKKIIDVFFL